MYLERHEPDPTKHGLAVAVRQLCSVHRKCCANWQHSPMPRSLLAQDALSTLVAAALELSQIAAFTGRDAPSVIT